MAEAVGVEVDAIVLESGLPIDFNPGGPNGPRIHRLTKVLRDAGVECLTLDHRHPENPVGLYANLNLGIRYAWNTWVSQVDLGDTFNNHARVERSAKVVLVGNRFGDQLKSLLATARPASGRSMAIPAGTSRRSSSTKPMTTASSTTS